MSGTRQLLAHAALIATLAFNAAAQTFGLDQPGISSTTTGGKLEADLAPSDHSNRGLSDFAIEFQFRRPAQVASQFDLKIDAVSGINF